VFATTNSTPSSCLVDHVVHGVAARAADTKDRDARLQLIALRSFIVRLSAMVPPVRFL
jgi:hypothetical protein